MPPFPPRSSSFNKDVESGKRDDDLKPRAAASFPASYLRPPLRKRRLLVFVAVVVLLYVLIHNIPTDLGSVDQQVGRSLRPNYNVGRDGSPVGIQQAPSGAPPRPQDYGNDEDGKHYFSGPIKFYRLATSLHAITRTMGHRPTNRNILFAASSLKSASNLIPMACEMATWDRNYVHLALLGRESLPLDDVLEINGVDKESCAVYFHDGRADYSEYSTDVRAEVAAAGALNHINDFMHPQAIIMDDSAVEDQFFTRAVRGKAKAFGRAVIEVPAGGYEDFLYMTRLDSGSLADWHKPKVDILVHASPGSSGSLIRMIKSLLAADYTGLHPPRLTIELPSTIEPFLQHFLQRLQWPPANPNAPMQPNTLTLRHKIPSQRVSSEQSSLRFLESFYPTNTGESHVLILSAQAELSPLYMHYLHYAILEYRHASFKNPSQDKLFGISLEVPSTFLNGSEGFVQPVVSNMKAKKYTSDEAIDQSSLAPFMYEAPSSSAALYFGDSWTEVHDFLTNRLVLSGSGKAQKTKKLVSEAQPAWMEYLLELIRARSYKMLYPALSLGTVHNELAQVPEEYTHIEKEAQQDTEKLKQPEHPEEEAFLTADTQVQLVDQEEKESLGRTQPLHALLPFDGDLPELSHLPLLSHTAEQISRPLSEVLAREASHTFRMTVGGCEARDAGRPREIHEQHTGDLFCLPGQESEYQMLPDPEESKSDQIAAKAAAIVNQTPPSVTDAEEDGDDEDEPETDENGIKKVAPEPRGRASSEDGDVVGIP